MKSRTPTVAAAILLAVQAIALGILLASIPPVELPASVDFGGGIQLTTVNLGAAALVLLVFAAICRAAAARWRTPLLRWIEWSQVSGVAVFLLAQLNGIQDVAALVSLYALAAGATLFLVLHERDAGTWTYSFGAAVAIVPWGVIAFYQVGALVIGDPPSVLVRVVTVVLLLFASAYWYDMRLAKVRSRPAVAEWSHLIFVVLTVSVLAWTTVLASSTTGTTIP